MLFDTHVHYNLSPLYENWQRHWQKAQAEGVSKSLVVGAGLQSSQRAVEIASSAEGLYAAIGKHPDVYREAIRDKLKAGGNWETILDDIEGEHSNLVSLVKNNHSKVAAIGEVGLDYYRCPEKGDKREWILQAQTAAFKQHIALAQQFDLPLVIHVRDRAGQSGAQWETLEILKLAAVKRFVLHCASGPIDYIKKALEMGGYIGVDGNVGYETADDIRQLIKIVPADRLLLETDAPYLAPEPHKGELCEPWMVKLVGEYVEKEFGVSQQQLYANAMEFFSL